MSARRKAGDETHKRLLHAAVELFLLNGYQGTTMQMIAGQADVTAAAMYRHFADKEAVLFTLIHHMFESQFALAESLLGQERDSVLLYGMETALQLHITELSAPLRDLYVTAYSLPTTSEFIYQRTAIRLEGIFGPYLPGWSLKDFYEMEIASAGIVRGYMARSCDLYFPIEQKIRRFLDASMKLYEVPADKRQQVTAHVLALDLHGIADRLIQQIRQLAANGLLTIDR